MFVALSLLGLFSSINFFGEPKLHLLDYYEIPSNATFDNTPIGGLSGIDYDSAMDLYYVVSDDRSQKAPARYYKLKIDISNEKIDTVIFNSKVFFQQTEGDYFRKEYCDFESIRYHPEQQILYVGTEGGKKGEPGILTFKLHGHQIGEVPFSASLLKSVRPNKSFEALSFSPTYKSVLFMMESSSKNKPEALSNSGVVLGIEERSVRNNQLIDRFRYDLSPLPQRSEAIPPWGGSGADNGVTEILTLSEREIIIIERSGAYQSNGSFHFISKVFYMDLVEKKHYKHLLYDFSQLGTEWNIEGVCTGPLINGSRTLIFISDNNFGKHNTGLFLFSYK